MLSRFTCSEKNLIPLIKKLEKKGILPIIDYINENKNNHQNNFNKLINIPKDFPNSAIAIKLSSIYSNNDDKNILRNKLEKIITSAIDNKCKIMVDAEDNDFYIKSDYNNIVESMLENFNKDNVNVYKTYQMYRKDSLDLLKYDINRSYINNYYIGYKLVRGAYYFKDKDKNILFNNIFDTHSSFDYASLLILNEMKLKDRLLLATHNENSINSMVNLTENNPNPMIRKQSRHTISYSQLLGMSDNLTNKLANKKLKVYKYIPFGNFLETIPYLTRRLYENLDILKYL